MIAAAPLTASADICPTRADLESGITLRDGSRNMTVGHRIVDGALITETTMEAGTSEVTLLTTYPHPLALFDDRPTQGARYNGSFAGLDSLDQSGEWSKRFTVYIQRATCGRGEHTVTFEGLSSVSFGPCQYDAWNLREVFTMSDDKTHTATRTFVPELWLVIAQSDRLGIGYEPNGPFAFDQILAE